MSVTLSELEGKYRGSADPWQFRTSPYEQEKFAATRAALARRRYASAVELGCGNGALAEHLAPLCDDYIGIDAVARAVAAARQAVPEARFLRRLLPCALPGGDHDLIVLSEILYFLGAEDIRRLAAQISGGWPRAEILCVTWLGDTGHALQGEEALNIFCRAMGPEARFATLRRTSGYRIDRHVPHRAAR